MIRESARRLRDPSTVLASPDEAVRHDRKSACDLSEVRVNLLSAAQGRSDRLFSECQPEPPRAQRRTVEGSLARSERYTNFMATIHNSWNGWLIQASARKMTSAISS